MCQMIFFMDIDGTLKLSGLPLSRKMHEALRHLKKQGHAIIFCTGRTLLEIPDRWRHDGAIACFGHQIIYHDRILYQHPLTKGQDDHMHPLFGFGWSRVYTGVKQMNRYPIYKAVYWKRGWHVRYPDGMDKGKGIDWLSEALGHPFDLSIGIGNSLADLAMWRAVNIKVAVGHRCEALNHQADICLERRHLAGFLKGVKQDATYFDNWRRTWDWPGDGQKPSCARRSCNNS